MLKIVTKITSPQDHFHLIKDLFSARNHVCHCDDGKTIITIGNSKTNEDN